MRARGAKTVLAHREHALKEQGKDRPMSILPRAGSGLNLNLQQHGIAPCSAIN